MNGEKLKPLAITTILLLSPTANNMDLKHDKKHIEWYYLTYQYLTQLHYEIIHKLDPHNTYKAKIKSVELEIYELLDKGTFKLIKTSNIPKVFNLLGDCFIISIKELGTPHRGHKHALSSKNDNIRKINITYIYNEQ